MSKNSIDSSKEEAQTNIESRRAQGEFVRGVSGFRFAIGDVDFPAELDRYHLFVALNCPWCHRVMLARNLLGLQKSITVDIVYPGRTDDDDPVAANLWQFNPEKVSTLTGAAFAECTRDTATGNNHRLIRQLYESEDSTEKSVPVLYDKKRKRIINNESAEIIRILNTQAKALGSTLSDSARPDLYPKDTVVRRSIDRVNETVFVAINNGAYKAGFSSDQAVYATAFNAYFNSLAELEESLASDNRPYITGRYLTEADVRLFPTLYRHDPVYYVRMKLNGAKILDYPHLWRWLCRMYAIPGVPESSSLNHCKQGYFGRSWNNVIPLGPVHPMQYPDAYLHPELARS